jgi:hypothetical protein
MRAYRVGTSLRHLRERVYTVGRSDIRLNDHQDSEVSHIPTCVKTTFRAPYSMLVLNVVDPEWLIPDSDPCFPGQSGLWYRYVPVTDSYLKNFLRIYVCLICRYFRSQFDHFTGTGSFLCYQRLI